jgi:hypothetical protein
LILYLFPYSAVLWQFLAAHGIYFQGDPHINRLVGVVFDPNFNGALIVFPILLGVSCLFAVSNRSGDIRYIACIVLVTCLLIAALILTFSRSAYTGCLIGLLVVGLNYLRGKFNYNAMILAVLAVFIGILLFGTVFSHVIDVMQARFSGVFSGDPSAQHRWHSLFGGLDYMLTGDSTNIIKLFGVGYNYLAILKTTSLGRQFDASILNLIVCFGWLGALIFISLVLHWLRYALMGIKQANLALYNAVVAYLVASFFMCFFNNLLFFPFYLLMFAPILFFGYWHYSQLRNTK